MYTESPSDDVQPVPSGYEMWRGDIDPTAYPDEPPVLRDREESQRVQSDQVDLSTAEAAARALFRALVLQDEQLLDRLLLSSEEYAQAARAGTQNAQEHMAEVVEATEAVWAAFRGDVPSEQRVGGVGSLVQLEAVRVGVGRLVSGEVAEIEAEATMVWGTEIQMRLRNTSQVFRLRLPKLLRAPDGHWGLADPPEIGGRLQMYLDMGFHLSPQLLAFEHYPLPLQTGNYWTYQVHTVPRAGAAEQTTGLHALDESLPRFRDEVVSRQDFDGYALARLRRHFFDPEQRDQTSYYLLTPRRVYLCNGDCRRNIEDISWLLSYLSSMATPVLVFPLRPGMGWRRGGRMDLEGEYLTWSDYEVADVPAGRFEQAVRVTTSTRHGMEHRFFSPGTGFVLERVDGSTETTFHALVEYRIIP